MLCLPLTCVATALVQGTCTLKCSLELIMHIRQMQIRLSLCSKVSVNSMRTLHDAEAIKTGTVSC